MDFFKRKRAVLLAVAIGTFMSALDGSVVNLVLPNISQYFHTPLSTIEWAIMSYLLVISSLLLAYGRLGDIYGHKKIYQLGFIIFIAGSILCGLSVTVWMLISFRALQAIGAGMIMAMGPAIINDTVSPRERGKALSVNAVAVAIALAVGPVIGGLLTSLFGWESIFWINLPIGLIGIYLGNLAIPQKEERSEQSFDYLGAIITFGALISILLPLSLVEQYGWHNSWLLSFIIFGIVLTGVFVWWEKRIEHPMFDIELFKNRLFGMSNLSALLNFMAQNIIILLIPFYLQQLRGLTPSRAGILYMPMPVATMIIAPISGTISDRMDSRYISSAGMAIMAFGMWLLSNLKADTSDLYLVLSLITVGLGMGLFQTPNNNAIMSCVPKSKSGIASGMLATMRNIGMVLGVAISGAVFSSSQEWLKHLWHGKGLTVTEFNQTVFVGALHVTYLVGVVFACIAVITSLIKGSTRGIQSEP